LRANVRWSRGLEFGKWLAAVGVAGDGAALPFDPANVSSSIASLKAGHWWIADGTSTTQGRAMGFGTPVSVATQESCGRVTFTDVHLGGQGMPSAAPVPASCGGAMSAEAKALEYLFFDLGEDCAEIPPEPVPPDGLGGP
jgi:hypothetical protein